MIDDLDTGRRLVFGDGAYFIPKCVTCCRYVKADDTIRFSESGDGPPVDRPNATCSKCGRTQMIFEGYA